MSDTLTDETKESLKKVATRIKNLESENERLRTINKEQQTSHELYLETWLKNIKEKTETYESANKSKYKDLNTKYNQLKINCDNRDVKAEASVKPKEDPTAAAKRVQKQRDYRNRMKKKKDDALKNREQGWLIGGGKRKSRRTRRRKSRKSRRTRRRKSRRKN